MTNPKKLARMAALIGAATICTGSVIFAPLAGAKSLLSTASGPGTLVGGLPPPTLTGHGGDVSTGVLRVGRGNTGSECGTAGIWYKYSGAHTWDYGFSMTLETGIVASPTSYEGTTWSGVVQAIIHLSNGTYKSYTWRIPVKALWTSVTHTVKTTSSISWVAMRSTWHIYVYSQGSHFECYLTSQTGPKDYT